MKTKDNALNALKNVKLSNIASNAEIQTKLIARAEQEKETYNTVKHMLKASIAISSTDLVLNTKVADCAAYALEKVAHVLNSIKSNTLAQSKTFQSHLVAHVQNMNKRKTLTMTNKERHATSSINVECDTMRAKLDKRSHYAVSTATTQTSSTASALDALNIVDYDRVNKVMTLKDSDEAKALIALIK